MRKGSETETEVAPSILRQDNKSTIHLIVMERGSYRNSKHIRVRECFIRDLVRDKEMVVEWQHTSLMVADLLTKGVTRAVFEALLPALIGRKKECPT
ncbi:MAG: Ty1/Copia family ribonuclease HI [bacterium]